MRIRNLFFVGIVLFHLFACSGCAAMAEASKAAAGSPIPVVKEAGEAGLAIGDLVETPSLPAAAGAVKETGEAMREIGKVVPGPAGDAIGAAGYAFTGLAALIGAIGGLFGVRERKKRKVVTRAKVDAEKRVERLMEDAHANGALVKVARQAHEAMKLAHDEKATELEKWRGSCSRMIAGDPSGMQEMLKSLGYRLEPEKPVKRDDDTEAGIEEARKAERRAGGREPLENEG